MGSSLEIRNTPMDLRFLIGVSTGSVNWARNHLSVCENGPVVIFNFINLGFAICLSLFPAMLPGFLRPCLLGFLLVVLQ